jgi:hypothetical protein
LIEIGTVAIKTHERRACNCCVDAASAKLETAHSTSTRIALSLRLGPLEGPTTLFIGSPMQLSPTTDHQQEMRFAYYDGTPGILVSGLVWIAAAAMGYWVGSKNAVWTLLIGGALIHPLGLLVSKSLGRPAKTAKGNALNPLAIASTIWLILCCAMAYGLFLLKPELFFPAMMATIGSRYLVLASVFGLSVYWLLGGFLIFAANAAFFAMLAPVIAAAIGGLIEIVFAFFLFTKSTKGPDLPSLQQKKQ